MTTEPFDPRLPKDPADGTAAIPPVTAEMMQHAARAAAEMAESAAHDAPHPPAARATTPRRKGARDAQPPRSQTDGELAADGRGEAPGVPEQAGSEAAETPIPSATAGIAADPEAGDVTRDRPEAAEPSFTQGRPTVERGSGAARDVGGPSEALDRYNAKLVEAVRANMAATGSLMSALMRARSLPEAATINADYVERQFDTMTMQARELLFLVQKAAFDAMRPFEDASERSRDP